MSTSDYLAMKAIGDMALDLYETIDLAFEAKRIRNQAQQYNNQLQQVMFERDAYREQYEDLVERYREISHKAIVDNIFNESMIKQKAQEVSDLKEEIRNLKAENAEMKKELRKRNIENLTTTWTKSTLMSAMEHALEAYRENKALNPRTLFNDNSDEPSYALTKLKKDVENKEELEFYLGEKSRRILNEYDEIREK